MFRENKKWENQINHVFKTPGEHVPGLMSFMEIVLIQQITQQCSQ